MQSEWRVPNSSPFFMVSASGDVKTSESMKPVRKGDNGHGYLQVQIMRNGKRYTRYVHRLVAECFVANPNGFTEINHIDGDKKNNNAENLEWCSHSENLRHAYKPGLKPNTTPKQHEAARRNARSSQQARRKGWEQWAKTESARVCWLKNLVNANRWGKIKQKVV